MEPRDANIVITGAASGIGAALATAFAEAGAARLWLADLNPHVHEVAAGLGPIATAVVADAAAEADVVGLVQQAATAGPLDLFCANAGIATGQGLSAPDEVWDRIWQVNVLSHVYAARACLDLWQRVGAPGHLMFTASAAGLLTNLGDAPYTATKHAAVGLAEWITITHGDSGVGVSCLCPQGVRTPMVTNGLAGGELAAEIVELMGLIEPAECAAAAVAGLRANDFLILPHPEVGEYVKNKAADRPRWLGGMRKLQRQLLGGGPETGGPGQGDHGG
jgi:NAD(P)-dependent dehydrogenase (short-subunit alcohol dehydrogenase family)